MKKTTFAVSTAATSVTLLLLAAPLAASAHVQVTPDQAQAGSDTNLTFQVPTESATAGTVKVVIDLPTSTPLGSVGYRPVPGWTATVDTEKLATPVKTSDGTITEAPVHVTWTAQAGTQITPGQFQDFTLSTEGVPSTGKIVFPVHQFYSDGSVVNWTQPTPASGAEPEHPVPTLYVNDPAPRDSGGSPLVATSAPAPVASSAGGTAVAVSIGLGIAGLALGAIALVVAVIALSRRPGAGKVQR